VLDSAMERVMKLNIKVDVLLGDLTVILMLIITRTSASIEIDYTPDQKQNRLGKSF
jgi:thiamine pyrophosphokinase